MRIDIVAHGLHSGGGVSVSQNIAFALCRSAPQHHYLALPPGWLGLCAGLPRPPQQESMGWRRTRVKPTCLVVDTGLEPISLKLWKVLLDE